MHSECRLFVNKIKTKYPEYFTNKQVLEIGSYNVNGTIRDEFKDCEYTGIDVLPGKDVDVVSVAHEYLPEHNFDVIISMNSFEHDMYYKLTLAHIMKLLRPKGLLLFSCPSTGWKEHGTLGHTPSDLLTVQLTTDKEWNTYYRNLTEDDIRSVILIDGFFKEYEFTVGTSVPDLQFYGVRV